LEAHNELEPLDNRRARAEAKVTILQRELAEALEQVQQLEEKLKLYEPDPPSRKGRKGRS
jgi:chromosome segregation ATPase